MKYPKGNDGEKLFNISYNDFVPGESPTATTFNTLFRKLIGAIRGLGDGVGEALSASTASRTSNSTWDYGIYLGESVTSLLRGLSFFSPPAPTNVQFTITHDVNNKQFTFYSFGSDWSYVDLGLQIKSLTVNGTQYSGVDSVGYVPEKLRNSLHTFCGSRIFLYFSPAGAQNLTITVNCSVPKNPLFPNDDVEPFVIPSPAQIVKYQNASCKVTYNGTVGGKYKYTVELPKLYCVPSFGSKFSLYKLDDPNQVQLTIPSWVKNTYLANITSGEKFSGGIKLFNINTGIALGTQDGWSSDASVEYEYVNDYTFIVYTDTPLTIDGTNAFSSGQSVQNGFITLFDSPVISLDYGLLKTLSTSGGVEEWLDHGILSNRYGSPYVESKMSYNPHPQYLHRNGVDTNEDGYNVYNTMKGDLGIAKGDGTFNKTGGMSSTDTTKKIVFGGIQGPKIQGYHDGTLQYLDVSPLKITPIKVKGDDFILRLADSQSTGDVISGKDIAGAEGAFVILPGYDSQGTVYPVTNGSRHGLFVYPIATGGISVTLNEYQLTATPASYLYVASFTVSNSGFPAWVTQGRISSGYLTATASSGSYQAVSFMLSGLQENAGNVQLSFSATTEAQLGTLSYEYCGLFVVYV